jgi:signal peptidase II
VVLVDRLTKIVVERRYGVGYGPREVIDHILFLTVTRNRGAAFGLFQNFTLGFLLVSIAVMIGILFYYGRLRRRDWTGRLGLALIFGGAISNAYDRGIRGSVIDFIQVPHWPVFNVADSAITVGVVLLVLGGLFRGRRRLSD